MKTEAGTVAERGRLHGDGVASSRGPGLLGGGFNVQMCWAALVLLAVSIPGFWLTHTHVPYLGSTLLAMGIFIAVLLPVVLYLEEKGKRYWVEFILTLFWVLFFTYTLNFPVVLAARLGLGIGLKDAQLVRFDQAIGMPIPAIVTWASRHWLGKLASACYFPLINFMRLAVVLPVVAGRARSTQQFLRANLLAFAIGLPLFALVPAVGPWFGYPMTPRPDQLESQATLMLLRHAGQCEYRLPVGIICFPSFHVVWALLCTQALWAFKWLRIPAVVFAGLIVMSTVTTGEHYVLDLIAGAVVAGVAMTLAARWTRLSERREQGSPARAPAA